MFSGSSLWGSKAILGPRTNQIIACFNVPPRVQVPNKHMLTPNWTTIPSSNPHYPIIAYMDPYGPTLNPRT